jgi:hypothetical protein
MLFTIRYWGEQILQQHFATATIAGVSDLPSPGMVTSFSKSVCKSRPLTLGSALHACDMSLRLGTVRQVIGKRPPSNSW